MITLPKLAVFLTVCYLVWLFVRNNQFRERALKIAIVQCRENGIQHLDQNIVLKRMWPKRGKSGWVFRRVFQFEFTSTGERRSKGTVVFEGHTFVGIDLEAHRIPQMH